MTKVKAHRRWQDATSPIDEVHIHGTSVADQVADRCISNYLYDDEAKVKPQHKMLVDKMVVALLEARDEQDTIPKPKRVVATWLRKHRAIPEGQKHQMLWNKHCFSCRNCCKRFPVMPSPDKPCLGAPSVSRGLVANAAMLGHVPVVISVAGKRKGLLVLCTKCGAYGADKVVLLAKPCQQQKTSRSGPIGMLERGRHPICKDTWVDRVWKYCRPAGGQKACLVDESGYGQGSKRPCTSGIGTAVGVSRVSASTSAKSSGSLSKAAAGTQPSDDAHWEALAEQAQGTIAQDGEWDLSELMDLFGD